ncbi:MAG: hypothetical protein M1274_08155 [Actinobacteria bacterium]|nr:hypothetical protein [Actinomycetota bacterium]
MHVRISTFKIAPQDIDDSVRQFREDTLPEAMNIPGFQGATLLVDREAGMTRSLTYWNSRESLESSSVTANRLRAKFVQDAGNVELVSVETYEVAVDEGNWQPGKTS